MKKLCLVVLLSALVVMFSCQDAFSAMDRVGRGNNLYSMCEKLKTVKVYVNDVTDSSGATGADLAGIKKAIENVFETRLTTNFDIVPNKEDANIEVSCDVTESLWTENDPIDMMGAGGIVFDALTRTDYARVQAVFIVKDVKKDKVIWKKKLKATLSDEKMMGRQMSGKRLTKEEAMVLVNDTLADVFMRDGFGKVKSGVRKGTPNLANN